MSQSQLFYEDVFDVARAAMQAAGGAKQVAGKLWPNTPISEAQRKLLDSLNRERPEKLCIEEFLAILKLAKEVGFHQAKHWIDAELGYQPTPPSDPKVERDKLAEEFARAADAFKNLQRTAERLLNEPQIKAVK
jgi:hypothetical protein